MRRSRFAYRALLRLMPRDIRTRFGSDMEQLFVDRLREVEGRRAANLRLWAAGVWDIGTSAAGERGGRALAAAGELLTEGAAMDGWIQDVRFGVRSLRRRPGFALAAIVTLALGMGANVAIFSVVDGVLLEPLPYPDSGRLITLWSVDTETGARGNSIDHPDLAYWHEAVTGLDLVGYAGTRPTLTGLGEPEVIFGTRVTDGLVRLMGYAPFLGRDLTRADDVADGPRAAVVSYAFWSERLARDPSVIGTTLTLNGDPWEIVGIAPEGFDYPSGSSVWLARRHDPEGCGHGCRIMSAIGRLDVETPIEIARARMTAASASLAADFPDQHGGDLMVLERLIDAEVADVRAGLWILLGAVGMVLMIACANVANLMLVRASGRSQEVALRFTLGASRARVTRQLLTESLAISVAAGLLGLCLAMWSTHALVALAPDTLPRLAEAQLDGTVLGFAAVLVVIVTGLFGVFPALRVSGQPLAGALGDGVRAAGQREGGRSRSLLLAGEVALSLSLLLGAGLLFRTLAEIRTVDFGFSTSGVERFRLNTPDSRYDAEATIRFQDILEERLAALPGVVAAGMGFGAPLASGSIFTYVELLDRPPVDQANLPSLAVRPSTPGFLNASGTELLRGRWFTRADRRDSEAVAVINEAGARTFWPDSDPIGKQIQAQISWGFNDDPPRTVVGVVTDVRARSATTPPAAALYFPNAQFAANSIYVTLRLSDGVATVMPGVREVLAELDSDLAVTGVERMEDVIAAQQASTRFYLTLLSLFSVLALVLAAIGLYGVVAYSVSQRTREIGIRIALGARPDDVTRLVVLQGTHPALAGIALGLAMSWVGGRLISSLLYGVAPRDPVAVLGATTILLAVVLVATVLPASRASRVLPASALRSE